MMPRGNCCRKKKTNQHMKSKLSCLILFFALSVQAQSPYELKLGKECAFFGLGIAPGLTGAQLRTKVPVYTVADIAALDAKSINAFDRKAVDYYSDAAHQASNFFWYSTFAAPLLFLPGKTTRSHFGTIAVLWGETVMINAGLTVVTKYASRRTRPYVYNPDVPADKKLDANAKGSFFSGHASMSAANSFFAAKVFSDYHPDSKWKPVVWSLAAVVPAVTGYLRIRGGRHFPTDVLTGYAVGALVGWGVPALHRSAAYKQDKLTIGLGMNSMQMSWVF